MKTFFLNISIFLLGVLPVQGTIKVGVTPGPHAMIMEKVKNTLVKEGIDMEIIEFNDFILPNEALNNGELDVNSMQHQPYLDHQCRTRGYTLISIAKTVLMPLGVYSKKTNALNQLPMGAQVAIPNDPTNSARALLLLQSLNLVELSQKDFPSLLDIKNNPKNLKIIELEAPLLPQSLDDVDIAVINTDWVVLSNLNPSSALATESTNSPYTNVLVVKNGHENRADIQHLVKTYQSQDIKTYIIKEFKGAVLPAW